MSEVFDNRASSAALVLEKASGTFEDFVDKVERSGTAAKIASEQMDNLKGDFKELNSAWEGMLLSWGQATDGFMRNTAQMVTGLLRMSTGQNDLATQLEGTLIQMNAEMDALKSGNVHGEQKVRLMEAANRKYRDYLPFLFTEKTSIEEINEAQIIANGLLLEKIKLRAQEKVLQDSQNKIMQLQVERIRAIIELEKLGEVARVLATEEYLEQEQAIWALDVAIEHAAIDYEQFVQKLMEGNDTLSVARIRLGHVAALMGNLSESSKGVFGPDWKPPDIGVGGGGIAEATRESAEAAREAAKAARKEFNALEAAFGKLVTRLSSDFRTLTKDQEDQIVSMMDGLNDMKAVTETVDLTLPFLTYIEVVDDAITGISALKLAHIMAFAEMEVIIEHWAAGLVAATAASGNAVAARIKQLERLKGEELSTLEQIGVGMKEFGDVLRSTVMEAIALYIGKAVAALVGNAIETSASLGPWGFLIAPVLGSAAAATAISVMNAAIPEFHQGIDYVPYDLTANLKQGETVLNPGEAAAYRAGGGGQQTVVVMGELHGRVLKFMVDEENRIVGNTS